MTDYTKAVSSLLHKFQSAGFYIDSVYDGAQRETLRYLNSRDARKDAIKIILSVDESCVCIKQNETNKPVQLLIVLGNENCELLGDFCAPLALMPLVESISDKFYDQWA
jgi:hypothetical protein